MKIAFIKKLNQNLPYWVKRPFSRIIRNKLTGNEVFLKQYEILKKSDSMTKDERNKLQLELLRETLNHAYYHTVFYRQVMDRIGFDPQSMNSVDDIKQLPTLTKELIRKNYDELKSDDIHDYYVVRTSGTTGAPTQVLMERNAIYREWAFVYHYWSKFGYDFRTSKLATFRGVDLHQKLYEINPLYQEIRLNVFRLNNDNIQKYVRLIDYYKADFIYGYPSAIYNFCRLAKDTGIDLAGRFKAVFLISENLYDFQEAEIKDVLVCPIAMFYGHSERAVYAEKYGEGYVFQPLYGVTEINQDGVPIVTGFINGKMPIIRYELDDLVERLDVGKMVILGHRNSEVVYGANGEQFRATALNFHGLLSTKFSWFQFVQEVPGELFLRLPVGSVTEDEINRLTADFDKRLGKAIKVRVELVDPSAGKVGGVQIQTISTKNTASLISDATVVSKNTVVANKGSYKIVGHWDADVLKGKKGESISAAEINFHDDTFEGVRGYQFVQDELGKCQLLVVPDISSFSRENCQRISRRVASKFGDAIVCEVQIVNEVQLTDRGKYKLVVQNLK